MFWDDDAAKILKDRSVSSFLQYDVQLGINHDTLESVLTLLLYDFAMEGRKLRFAVSIEMGNVLTGQAISLILSQTN